MQGSQDTRSKYNCPLKSQLLSYMSAKNNWNLKLKKKNYNNIKKIKYLGINLTKYLQDLYVKNYTTVMKKTKEDINRKCSILCSYSMFIYWRN